MPMSPRTRKLMLAAHIVSSTGWIGALLVFLAHALASWTSRDVEVVRAAAVAMDLSAWYVILPLAIASLATGVAQALGTPWGLLRHYWVIFKLVVTIVATAVLLSKLGPISELANAGAAAAFTPLQFGDLRMSMVLHAAGGLVILVAAALLAVFKPAGATMFHPDRPTPVRVPRWVRISAWSTAALLAVVLLMIAGGKHGPQMHGGKVASQVQASFR